ncbi:uncharacterized protein B0P05DRAFT_529412 [Gilbertella persicaria]|uniref:uncharacterized protein n=1 Tax=Gilbertella persicaria TaxID=101096 RepID=UPI00221F71E1|nr:uncharacterized protein B0P05DRAFT_529412 [Gilbertella persicaria]KAI8090116.1 hypothetical protein B0P05DRAFT_529412 [Gilbertella persicaria]
MTDNDLSHKLNAFSLSTTEEKVAHQLEHTHLTTPSIFSVPNQPATQDWHTTQTPSNKTTEEGWGEGPPSYTSVFQDTHFGFNSILHSPITPHHPTEHKAFNQFKHKPVTFLSAAKEHK